MPAAVALLVVALVFGALTGPVRAQDGFRVTFDVERPRPDQARLVGRVVNESADAFDVNITVEALDPRGKVVARGLAYVDGRIGRGESRPFVAVVPAPPSATRFRIFVTSVRPAIGGQGP